MEIKTDAQAALADTTRVITDLGTEAVKTGTWIHAHWLWLVVPICLICGMVLGFLAHK